MPSDYELITKENIRRRGEEFDDIGRLLSEQLYSDRTRFIYELLQNAEDALERRFQVDPESSVPCSVNFCLFPDHLEFCHFGLPFDTEDVRAICDVLKGTKSGDINQIGKFGIGFKSVYGFTSCPEIRSGDEHFIIERYIRPRKADDLRSTELGETVFIFPFNHGSVSQEESFQLISEKLHKLGAQVLLFLSRINEIRWSIGGEQKGSYVRHTEALEFGKRVSLIDSNTGKEKEDWFVLDRPVQHPENGVSVKVEAAFRLIEDGSSNLTRIVRTRESPLVVFFPTEKETRLGFLLQGAYRTTPSRDNIPKEDSWNRLLVQETAKLVVDALGKLKRMSLVSISLLEVMPTRLDDFPQNGMFRPVAETILKAFRTKALLPADDGTYTFAAQAKLARSQDLRDLLHPKQLKLLFSSEKPLKWLPGEITQDRAPDLRAYLLRQLGVEEVTPETFVRRITVSFLEEQTDEWMARFYTYLTGQESLWRAPRWPGDPAGPLRDREFIRLEEGKHIAPFRADGIPNCYLPSKAETEFPVVRHSIAANQGALKFLEQLGLTEPNVVAEVIERILPRYSTSNRIVDISEEEHKKNITKILRALKTDSQEKRESLVTHLRGTPFLLAASATGEQSCYAPPNKIYLRTPELETYFHNDADAWFLNEIRGKGEWIKLGVEDKPRRIPLNRRLSRKRAEIIRGDSGCTRELSTADYSLHGMNHFLECLNEIEDPESKKSRALILWNFLIKHIENYPGHSKEAFFHGEYRWFYYSEHKRSFEASWVKALRTTRWLPSRKGGFLKPGEISLEDLPKGFKHDETLRKELRMKSNEMAALADKAGIKLDDIELLKSYPEEFRRWKADMLESRNKKPEFPARPSQNRELRQERLSGDLDEATEKAYENRDRRVRTSVCTIDPVTLLRNNYTNNDGQMICQICNEEMPFKKRDGQYYFEAVELVSDIQIEHEALFLALCPLCSAKYKEFVKRDLQEMQKVKQAVIEREVLEIPINLDTKGASIRFVATHLSDLKTIFKLAHIKSIE